MKINEIRGRINSSWLSKLLLSETKRTAHQVTWSKEVLESLPVPGPNTIEHNSLIFQARSYKFCIRVHLYNTYKNIYINKQMSKQTKWNKRNKQNSIRLICQARRSKFCMVVHINNTQKYKNTKKNTEKVRK